MNIDDTLGEKFNLEKAVEVLPAAVPAAPVPTATGDTVDEDTERARTTLNTLIDKSLVALEHLITIAKQSEEPRAYEVVAQMIKATADTSKDLLKIQKDRQDLRPNDDERKPSKIGTQQNIFVGSTNDLLRAMRTAGLRTLPSATAEIVDAEVEEMHG